MVLIGCVIATVRRGDGVLHDEHGSIIMYAFSSQAAAAAKDEFEVDEDAIDDAAVAEAIARAAADN